MTRTKKELVKRGNKAITVTGLCSGVILLTFVIGMFAMLFSNTAQLKTVLVITDIIAVIIITVMQVRFRREIKLAMKEM